MSKEEENTNEDHTADNTFERCHTFLNEVISITLVRGFDFLIF